MTSETEYEPPRRRDSGSMLVEEPQPDVVTDEDLRGKTVVVTGGATGLGREIALEFAAEGVNVAFNYIRMPGRDILEQALLTETALRARGVEVYGQECDVRNPAGVEDFIRSVARELGGVHFLVNNAGIGRDGALWRMSEAAWRDVMETNVTGAFNCIKAVATTFRRQRYGRIVSVSSHHAHHPGFGVANYAASKSALIGLTRSAAVELGPSNVTVNAVAPGFIRTERMEELPEDIIERARKSALLGRVAEPRDVSRVVTFLCSEAARHITGQIIIIDGGMTLT